MFWFQYGTNDLFFTSIDVNGNIIKSGRKIASPPLSMGYLKVKPILGNGEYHVLLREHPPYKLLSLAPDGKRLGKVKRVNDFIAPQARVNSVLFCPSTLPVIKDMDWSGGNIILSGDASYIRCDCTTNCNQTQPRVVFGEVSRCGDVIWMNALFGNYSCSVAPCGSYRGQSPFFAWNGRGGGFLYDPTSIGSFGMAFTVSGCDGPEIIDGQDNDCNGLVDDGLDPDGDGFDTPNDNCPNVFNSGQSDLDDDHRGDSCDCRNLVDESWHQPEAILELDLVCERGDMILWGDRGRDVKYDLFMGNLAELQVFQSIPDSGCIFPDLTMADPLINTIVPPVGEGYFFLVRETNDCGVGTFEHGEELDIASIPACP
jgi:hypothetical protein